MKLLMATWILLFGGEAGETSEWPTYHGGFSLNGVADSKVPDSPVRLWRFRTGGTVETPPVSAGGRIFFTTSRSEMIALDGKGAPVWKIGIEKDSFSSPLLVTEGIVVAGTLYGKLHAFEAESGKRRWEYELGDNIMGTPNRVDLAEGKKAIVVNSQADGSIHCVDIATGKRIWKTEEVDRCDGSASVGGDRIVMGSCASALHVFSVEKAAKMTDIPFEGDGQIAGGVAFSGTVAFAGTRDGRLFAVDVSRGTVAWVNADSRGEAFATPAADDRFVVFSSNDGQVYGLDRETGKKIWAFDTEEAPLSPVIAGDRVVVSAGGTLFLLDRDSGKKIWSVEVSDWITSPAVVGGKILVGADDGSVSAYGTR